MGFQGHFSLIMFIYIDLILFLRVLFGLTTTFMSLTPYMSFYYGFVGGCVVTGSATTALYSIIQARTLYPENAFKLAMSLINKDEAIKLLLGKQYSPGKFRTYKVTGGYVGSKDGFPTWISAKVEMVFNINGSNADAVVSLCTSKEFLKEKIDYLKISIVDSNQDYLLVGNDESWQHDAILSNYVSLQSQKFKNLK